PPLARDTGSTALARIPALRECLRWARTREYHAGDCPRSSFALSDSGALDGLHSGSDLCRSRTGVFGHRDRSRIGPCASWGGRIGEIMESIVTNLHLDLTAFIWHSINFVVLTVALWWLLFRPLIRLIDERRARIQESLVRAEEVDRQAAAIEAEREA